MSRAFATANEYIEFLTNMPFERGEVIFTSFLPSALFQKDVIEHFYARYDAIAGQKSAAELLWNYGKLLRRAVTEGYVNLYIEERALIQFCRDGIVHDAYPEYEVGFGTRGVVLKTLKKISKSGNVAIISGVLPYIFRLIPKKGVLLDVINNTADQKIQGLWLDEDSLIKAFSIEAQRLIKTAPEDGRGNGLLNKLDRAINEFKYGYPVEWRKDA